MIGLGTGLGLTAQRRGGGSGAGSSPAALRTIAILGDSFAQRGMDILGSPNSVDAGVVDPQLLKWPTQATIRIGGVQWGFASHLNGAGFRVPQSLCAGIGGFNSGQLVRSAAFGSPTPHYLDILEARLDTAPFAYDAVIWQAGTNDSQTAFSAEQSYANILGICKRFADKEKRVFLSTILPRGHAASTPSRLTTPQIAIVDQLNGLLVANLAAEPSLNGRVHVIDPRAQFRDTATGALPNDILPVMVYDGLHLSPTGCRVLARAYEARLAAVLGAAPAVPATAGDMVANPGLTGTSGTRTFTSGGTTATGFSASGTVATGATLTAAATGLTSWYGASGNNMQGTVVSSVTATGMRIVVNCSVATMTAANRANIRGLELRVPITLPATSVLAEGAYYEAIARASVTGHEGFAGISVEVRATEGGVQRTVRSAGNAAGMNLAYLPSVDLSNETLRTPPLIRKAGTYAGEAVVMLYFSGKLDDGNDARRATVDIPLLTVRASAVP